MLIYLIYFAFLHFATSELDYVAVTQSTVPLNCQDQHEMCYYWLHNNECGLNEIIPRLCPKGCKLCEPKPKPILPRSTDSVAPLYQTQPSAIGYVTSKQIIQPLNVLNQSSTEPAYHTSEPANHTTPLYYITKPLPNNQTVSPSSSSQKVLYLREALEIRSFPVTVSGLQKFSTAQFPPATVLNSTSNTNVTVTVIQSPSTVLSPSIGPSSSAVQSLPTTVASTVSISSSTVGRTVKSATAIASINSTQTTLSGQDPFQISLVLKPVKGTKSDKPIDVKKDLLQEKELEIHWGEWTSWGKCTIGRQFRTRTCGRGESKFCSGSDFTFRLCDYFTRK